MAKGFRINLLKKKSSSVVAEISLFFNSYAKYIIIITQLVVLGVFFVKIVLDQTIIDLKDSIDQKNQIILTSEPMIQNNNNLVSKLTFLNSLIVNTDSHYAVLTTALVNTPRSVTLGSLSLSTRQLSVSGSTYEVLDIKRFQLNIQKKLGRPIKIDRINKEANLYFFEIIIPMT